MTTELPSRPTDADGFIDLMTHIWTDASIAVYDEWHNARKTAKALGFKRLYAQAFNADEPGYCYRSVEGDKLIISQRGGAVRLNKTHI